MGKTRDFFKKIRDTKGIFHANLGTVKDRNDVQAGFRKGRGNQRSNCQHPLDHGKGKRVPKKNTSISALLTMPKPLCGSQ